MPALNGSCAIANGDELLLLANVQIIQTYVYTKVSKYLYSINIAIKYHVMYT